MCVVSTIPCAGGTPCPRSKGKAQRGPTAAPSREGGGRRGREGRCFSAHEPGPRPIQATDWPAAGPSPPARGPARCPPLAVHNSTEPRPKEGALHFASPNPTLFCVRLLRPVCCCAWPPGRSVCQHTFVSLGECLVFVAPYCFPYALQGLRARVCPRKKASKLRPVERGKGGRRTVGHGTAPSDGWGPRDGDRRSGSRQRRRPRRRQGRASVESRGQTPGNREHWALVRYIAVPPPRALGQPDSSTANFRRLRDADR